MLRVTRRTYVCNSSAYSVPGGGAQPYTAPFLNGCLRGYSQRTKQIHAVIAVYGNALLYRRTPGYVIQQKMVMYVPYASVGRT